MGLKIFFSLAQAFLEILIHTLDFFNESQLKPRSEQKLKRWKPGEQQGPDLAAHQTSARFELSLENAFVSAAKQGP